ncbi:MAG: TIGR03757 family integrating conjugative element protein [Woeseiaceae bacterium]|nr:TIGR03757 family integrating conjugative element protein [Woeseiaceae bacterium]
MPLPLGVPHRIGYVNWLMLLCAAAAIADGAPVQPTRIDVFVGERDGLHGWDRFSQDHPGIEIRVFEVTGIERLEGRLSKDLSADPVAAKRQALQRLGALDDAAHDGLKHSAVGLAEAVRLGVTRYPAMVFDSRYVIYGVTDLHQALELFRRRQGGAR